MSQPVLECVNDWVTDCLCGRSHMPCWPRPDTSCCSDLDTEAPGITPERVALIERMLHVSTEIMWRLSGKKYGACPVTVRPCRDDCGGGDRGYTWWNGIRWMPYLDNGVWFNDPCSTCPKSGCSCSEICEITLPGPVDSIISVTIDGTTVPPEQYRVDDGRKLVRLFEIGPLSTVTTMVSSAQVGPFNPANRWCDISPAPTSLLNADPVEPGGCYPSTANNPTFTWTTTDAVTATYDADSPDNIIVSFFDSATGDPFTAYTFPDHPAVFLPGEQITSMEKPDGSYMVITAVSGTMTGYANTDYGFVLEPGATIMMQRFGPIYGTACWPTCQDMNKPTTEVGTMAVTYRKGEAVPQGGLWAAGLLACQLIKACSTAADCALPSNAQRIVREGVTLDLDPLLIDATGFRTGIAEVDLWLSAVNPYRSTEPSVIMSPDTPRPRTTTWPCT